MLKPMTSPSPVTWRQVANIACSRFGFTSFRPDQRELIETALAGKNALGILPTGAGKSLCFHEILLLTPERLQNPEHVAPLKGRVGLFVIDEAHCVSQWDHDFRPAYLQLAHVIKTLGNPPILALTATAPPHLIEDLREALGVNDLRVVRADIERENLYLRSGERSIGKKKSARYCIYWHPSAAAASFILPL
jgi:superfamily II DNA helicase RecQ